MKLRSSTKIAIGFVIIVVGGYYGYNFAMRRAIMGERFKPLVPGRVNLVGINAGANYKIIVANRMAQLVQASDTFKGQDSDTGGLNESAIKKRVPVSDMLSVLQGDESKLGTFIMKVNDRDENDQWPPVRVVWTAERLTKALNGDKTGMAKLIHDLNVNLDGTPLPNLNRTSMENGIIIDYPVKVSVNYGGARRVLTGRVQEPFKPDVMIGVEQKLQDKQITNDMIAGYYEEACEGIASGQGKKQDIRSAILARLSPENARELAEAPQRILASASVVVNDSEISGASYNTYDTTDGKMSDLTIDMTDEGRRRLWQFSEDRVGTQIMLIVDGVPIAAPRISHALAGGQITITQMPDETLVKDTVDALNGKKGTRI